MSIISLDDYKSLTNTTSAADDTFINVLIPVVSSQIQDYCDRIFDKQKNYQWFCFDYELILPQWPINDVLFVGAPVQVATLTYLNNKDYNVEVKSDRITVTDINYDFTTDSYLFANYKTLVLLKAEIEDDWDIDVDIVTGFNSLNPLLLRPGTGKRWIGAQRVDAVTMIQPRTDRIIQFAQDMGISLSYTLDFYFSNNILIIWDSGYALADMPKDLKYVCAQVIKDILNGTGNAAKKINTVFKSESITNYNYQKFSPSEYNFIDVIQNYSELLQSFVKKNITGAV